MQAEAREDVAADHQLELQYQKQGQEYQKEVEELEAGMIWWKMMFAYVLFKYEIK